ncbi:MAG: DUF998 domain-containing protein [Candidatus Nanohaloarchaea archaeon]|nr:DUF998 domain-containing protein [Candidatus Nanohaloarchaea archaeon]
MPLHDRSIVERLYPRRFIRNATVWCGALAPLAGFATLIAASRLITGFSWQQNNLAALGNSIHTYFWVFRAGMLVTGVVGIPFAAALWRESEQPLKRSATLIYIASTTSLAALGYLPIDHEWYLSVELGMHILMSYTLFIFGTGEILDERPTRGLATIWLGVLGTTIWLGWAGGLISGNGSGIPEAAGISIFLTWMFVKAGEYDKGLLADIFHYLAVLRNEIETRIPF